MRNELYCIVLVSSFELSLIFGQYENILTQRMILKKSFILKENVIKILSIFEME